MRAPSFKAKAHRQSLAVANSLHAKADQDLIDAVSDLKDVDGRDKGVCPGDMGDGCSGTWVTRHHRMDLAAKEAIHAMARGVAYGPAT
jgi:Protein  of unknown function (DUF3018)